MNQQLNLQFESNQMTNFADILDKPADQIDRPKPLPIGSYLWTVVGLPRADKSRDKQTPFYEFTLKCMQPLDDVDEEALAEWAARADGSNRALTDFTTKLTYYVTEDSIYRLQDFLEHCGIDLDGKSIRQAIDETPNAQVGASIVHNPSKDGQSIYANIGKTFPAE